MKKIVPIILFLFGGIVNAQWQNMIPNYSFELNDFDTTQHVDSSKRHGLFGEALGGGGYYSIGYEYTIVNRQRYELLGSIGFSSNFKGKPQFDFGLPISLNNRVKFWRFNGIDLGASLGNFINIWAIIDQEKYFNCPLGNCNHKVLFFPSVHIGWYFEIHDFYLSPRFYGFINRSINGNGIELSPFFGLRFSYLIK